MQTSTTAANGVADSLYGLILTNDSLVELGLQMEQLLTLALHHPRYGDARPTAHHLSYIVGGDGMSGYNTYGSEVIALRGYSNYSLTETVYTENGSQAYAGYLYDKFTIELRYPVVLQPQSTIFVLAFLEGGNCWSDIRKFNPFQIKRSAGVGVRVFLPMIGLLGVDWGWGFDDPTNGKSQFHFVIGQQF